jgi:hypothetical protein
MTMGAADTTLLKEQADDLVGESLAPRGVPERVNYATGVLLGAEDFAAEQLYLRGRMGRAFAALYGHGTMAGLRVSCPANDNPELEVQVLPGLAMDRLGRLMEIRRTQCIHIVRWLAQRQSTSATALERAAVIDAVREDTPGERRLVFDVFARFAICPHGKTPAFAAGPFNATDYVVASRLADAFELSLQIAHVVGVSAASPKGTLAVPQPRSVKLEGMLADLAGIADPVALESARRAWCVESALDAWPQASQLDANRLPRLTEHASEADWDKVLLGRVSVPVTQADATSFPAIDAAAIAAIAASPEPADPLQEPKWRNLADNRLRPVVFNPYSWRGRLA